MIRTWMAFGLMLFLLIGSLLAQNLFAPRDAIFYMNDTLYGFVLYGGIAFLYLWFLIFSISGVVTGLRAEHKGLGVITLVVTIGAFALSAKGLTETITVSQSITKENCLKRIAPNADLSHCELAGVDLSGQNLSDVDLEDADLSHANLAGTTLVDAYLPGCDLSDANLSQANLTGADLYGVRIDNTNFENAIIQRSNMSNAWSMEGINFKSADLSGADLSSILSDEVDFSRAVMNGSNLQWVRIELFASFDQANLDGADLSHAYFHEVDFSNASLRNADLSEMNFSNGDFYNAEMGQAILVNFPLLNASDLTNNQINEVSIFLPNQDTLLQGSALSWASTWDKENGIALVYLHWDLNNPRVSYGYMNTWPQDWSIPDNWLAQVSDARKLEIIIFDEVDKIVKACYFEGPKCERFPPNLVQVERIRFDRVITIIEAQTGRTLGEKVFPGSEPASCPPTEDCGDWMLSAPHGIEPPLLGEEFTDYPAILEWVVTVLGR